MNGSQGPSEISYNKRARLSDAERVTDLDGAHDVDMYDGRDEEEDGQGRTRTLRQYFSKVEVKNRGVKVSKVRCSICGSLLPDSSTTKSGSSTGKYRQHLKTHVIQNSTSSRQSIFNVGNILLRCGKIPFGLKFFAYLCPNFGEQNLFLTWAAENFQDDSEIRGILPAAGNMLMSASTRRSPCLSFQRQCSWSVTRARPRSAFCVCIFGIFLMRFLFIRRAKQLRYVRNEYGLLIPPEFATQYVPRDEESAGDEASIEKTRAIVYGTEK
ncbi:hypothetical protein V1508DRAFT_437980 [Lipomyces doorenjongii]|uniref:uncharacterized protein n=1 Tax=Lipomyces doorenjongii TaxID=383834 RepID=UPI0034CE117F